MVFDTGLQIKDRNWKEENIHFELSILRRKHNGIRRRREQCSNRNKSNSILIFQNMYSRILRDY
jgi:hypothetical protein